jgi:ABC-type multidrug transport system ATPase subunit
VVNQNNTLWDALSCEDHLKLFARLRMRESEVADAVKATLERVELMPHADKPAGRLSGGMKRKLCGACALIGDPKIVLLDEPSAGLDPVSQRNLWNLIKATMAGRAVVLTTHSMVEADFLCDRIGIMVQGQLKCLGTSDHLKQRYASGYELVVKIEDSALDGVSSFVKEKFGATLAAADAGTLTYELSASSEKSADLLADAFEAFDDATRSKLKVAEFSVVQASLEKVFIRIVSVEGGEHEARDAHLKSIQVARDLGDDSDDDLDNFLFVERTCCNCSYFAHGLLCKYHSSCCCGMCTYMMLYIFGAPFVWFNTCTLTLLIHMFAALVNCVGRCCLQEPKAED